MLFLLLLLLLRQLVLHDGRVRRVVESDRRLKEDRAEAHNLIDRLLLALADRGLFPGGEATGKSLGSLRW